MNALLSLCLLPKLSRRFLYVLTLADTIMLAASRLVGFWLFAEANGGSLQFQAGDPIDRLLSFTRFTDNACWLFSLSFTIICCVICLALGSGPLPYVWHTVIFGVLPFPVLGAIDVIFSAYRGSGTAFWRPLRAITHPYVVTVWIICFVILLLISAIKALVRRK